MQRRNLILGSLAFLLYGCAKPENKKIFKNNKKRTRGLDGEGLDTKLQDPEDILTTIPSYVSGFQVGNRTVYIDDLVVYQVKKWDNLSKVAGRFYGSSNDWREVYELNKGVRKLVTKFNPQYLPYLIGDNPNELKEGQLIFLEKVVEDLTLPKGRRDLK